MEELRVGIAGTGFIGRVHARSARLAGGRIVAVAASSPETTRAAADELGAERAPHRRTSSMRDPDIDVVHICTPNHLHHPLAEAALAAGKHVVCEKPLALDLSEAEQLVAAAAESGRQAAVPFVYRFYPTVREARERVRSGGDRQRPAAPRHLPPGLAAAARGRQLACGRVARRRLASVRRHRLALVRPRRVRERPAGDAALGARAYRRAGARERRGPQGIRRRRRRRGAAGGDDRGRGDRAVRDRRRRARLRGDQPDLGGQEEPALDRDRRQRGGAQLRPGAARAAVGRKARLGDDRPARRRGAVGARGALRDGARRPSPGLRRLLRRLRGAISTRRFAATRCRTACRSSPDGLRAVQITGAVLASVAAGEWVDVAAPQEAVAR